MSNFTYTFPDSGLVFIKGKSGSGKSTIINLISLLDKPTSGSIFYDGDDILSYNEKQVVSYRKDEIGIIFQNYHLFEYETVLYNVELPLLIDNISGAEEIARDYLAKVDIKEDLFNHKVEDLSGGEKQRIALVRALIKNPRFLLCDEPTGAVDSTNSHIIMDLLKEESKHKLVIVVSHNEELINEYADQIITIDGGALIDSVVINSPNRESDNTSFTKNNKKSNLISKIAYSNFKRRKKQSIFNSVVMSICLLFSLLIIGFISNIDNLVVNQANQALDYGALTLYSVQTESIDNSNLSLVKSYRPLKSELNSISWIQNYYEIDYNLDYFIATGEATKDRSSLYELSFVPVYSYSSEYIDTSLLYLGEIPSSSFNEVLINTSAYNYLNTQLGIDPLGMTFSYSIESEISYTNSTTNERSTDTYIFDENFKIVGVVNDFTFLSSPTVYYSYTGFKDYLMGCKMDNLSEMLNQDITYYDFLGMISDNEIYTMYSYRLFLKDLSSYSLIQQTIDLLPETFSLTSNTVSRVDAFSAMLEAVRVGLIFFLVIVLIISLILLGIICLSSYISDSKGLAILLSLGLTRKETINMYIQENLISLAISLALSFVFSFVFQWIINWILKLVMGISPFIKIPFFSFMGIPLALPIIVIGVSLLALVIASSIPLTFKGKISLKEELQNND
ncbi:MAG: ATP-binding cassette domain-containing protein [Coprobacillus sp.]|nr:ATP-binding cassette domain-containing protein [Coprobacillus sp.]